MRNGPLKNTLLLLAHGDKRNGALIAAVANDAKKRNKVIKAMQARGIGVGIDPSNIAKWLEIFLKFLPVLIEILKTL